MQNEKLARAKEACRSLLTQLDPNDQICLVAFASHAHVLVHSATRSQVSAAAVDEALATLKAEGVTSLMRGLDEVFREVRRARVRPQQLRPAALRRLSHHRRRATWMSTPRRTSSGWTGRCASEASR